MDLRTEAERLIREHGLLKVLVAPVVALGAIGGVLWIPGPYGAGVAMLLTIVVLLALYVTESAKARELTEELRDTREVLRNLRDDTLTRHPANAVSELIRDEYLVSKKGDVTWIRTVRIRALDGPLHFTDQRFSGEELPVRDRHRMKIEANEEPGGGSPVVEKEWVGGAELRLVVHFSNPLEPDAGTATIRLKLDWPRTLPNLPKGGKERLNWDLRWPTERLEYVVILDSSLKRTSPLKIRQSGLGGYPEQRPEGGQWRIEGAAEGLPKGKRITLTLDASSG
jgi:hypothetical protein